MAKLWLDGIVGIAKRPLSSSLPWCHYQWPSAFSFFLPRCPFLSLLMSWQEWFSIFTQDYILVLEKSVAPTDFVCSTLLWCLPPLFWPCHSGLPLFEVQAGLFTLALNCRLSRNRKWRHPKSSSTSASATSSSSSSYSYSSPSCCLRLKRGSGKTSLTLIRELFAPPLC